MLVAVSVFAAPPGSIYNVTRDCGADNTGATDSTAAIQSCINAAYNFTRANNYTVFPVFFPPGLYLVSDTIRMDQQNPGPEDGINVCPSRYLPVVLWGSAAQLPARPTLRLAASAPGFGNASHPKAMVQVSSGGVSMNNVFRGIDIDLSAGGNEGAVGLAMAGAQGSVAQDLTVRATPTTYACFQGCNGAGGEHANIACYGARFGVWIPPGSQPVPVVVGATLVNQTESAIFFDAQATLAVTGAAITLAPGASGPAIASPSKAMSITDVTVDCNAAAASNSSTGIAAGGTVYLRDVYFRSCDTAVLQPRVAPVSVSSGGAWLHVAEYAKGLNSSNPYINADVVYVNGQRMPGGRVLTAQDLPAGESPPPDLLSRHLWDEAAFPHFEAPNVADARRDCGARGDDATDDAAALQACVDTHSAVYLPPGRYRLGRTLALPAGTALIGFGNAISVLVAASTGVTGASLASPVPLVSTSSADGPGSGASPTTIAFVGITIFQHLADTYALDWASRNPASLWRVGYESRPCECLWTTAWQQFTPATPIPCKLPVNITVPKSVFRGLGRVHAWVSDDTGGIISTGAAYRHLRVRDTTGIATADARLRFYSLNLEHAQSEANGDIINASWVDIYSAKVEGNTPLLWIRGDGNATGTTANVSVLALGGGTTAFAYNWTLPSDFTPALPSIFRLDGDGAGGTGTGPESAAAARTLGVKLAALDDVGYGASKPFWPPLPCGHRWGGHYPYPGEAVPFYPYGTWPNVTVWNCWDGRTVATAYWHMIATRAATNGSSDDGARRGSGGGWEGSAFMDKPALYTTY